MPWHFSSMRLCVFWAEFEFTQTLNLMETCKCKKLIFWVWVKWPKKFNKHVGSISAGYQRHTSTYKLTASMYLFEVWCVTTQRRGPNSNAWLTSQFVLHSGSQWMAVYKLSQHQAFTTGHTSGVYQEHLIFDVDSLLSAAHWMIYIASKNFKNLLSCSPPWQAHIA